MVCPVIPYITDAIQLIDMLEPYTDVIWIYGLSINDRSGKNWLNIQQILNNQFPDLIELEYTIKKKLKKDHAEDEDEPLKLSFKLPVTNVPAQVPRIVSAGIALSPYQRNEKYSVTEPRRRFL